MPDMNNVFGAVSDTLSSVGSEETVNSIVGSPLASGVRPTIGTSFLPKTQTLRLSSGGDPSKTGSNQNDRAQTPPATTNKIPRIYGKVTTGGVIVDAVKSSANTIFVAYVLSETNPDRFDFHDGTQSVIYRDWKLSDIYYENFQCEVATFDDASSFGNAATKVRKLIPIEGGSNVDISAANVLNVWAWAGNSSSDSQIFPYYFNNRNLYGDNAYDVFPTWDANVTMQDTVFAIVEIDRLNEEIDPTANIEIEEIGEWRFTVETLGLDNENLPSANARLLSNPAVALQDYMIDDRYGVGLSNADLDLNSFTDWRTYCDEQYPIADLDSVGGGSPEVGPDGVTYYIRNVERWRMDGFLNTQRPVAENIDEICKAGQGTLTYDNRQGKFKVLVNRPATDAELANAFVFNKDNILGGIQVSSTDLYSLYNFADCTFPNELQQDQPDTLVVETPASDKVTNEVTSGLTFQLTATNSRPRAAQMANTSLKASRVGTMIRFDADFSTIDVQVGDWVKVSDYQKGWDQKVFRVMRCAEIEDEGGELQMQFSCLEYNSRVYTDVIYRETTDRGIADGVGLRENYSDDSELNLADRYERQTPLIEGRGVGNALLGYDIIVSDDPGTGQADVYYANGTFNFSDTVSTLASVVNLPVNYDSGREGFLSVATTIDPTGIGSGGTDPNVPTDYSNTIVTLVGQDGNSGYAGVESSTNDQEFAGASLSTYRHFKLNKITKGTWKVEVKYREDSTIPNRFSQTATSGSIYINDGVRGGNGGSRGNVFVDTYGKGTVLTQTVTDGYMNTPGMASTLGQIAKPIYHTLANVKYGEFDFTTNYTVDWTSYTNADDIAFTPYGNITFVNDQNVSSHVFNIGGGGIQFDNITDDEANSIYQVPASVTSTINTDPAFHGLNADWYPASANVVFLGKGTMTNAAITDLSYTIINKDSYYRNA